MPTLLLDTFHILLMQTKTSFNSFHRRKSSWTARRPNFSCVSNFCCMVDTVDNGLLHAFQTNSSLNSPSTNDFYFCYTVIFFPITLSGNNIQRHSFHIHSEIIIECIYVLQEKARCAWPICLRRSADTKCLVVSRL